MEYVIRRGDTLGRIARANHTTVEELARLNNIKNVNLIRAGATLQLPGGQSAAQESQSAGAKNPLEAYRAAVEGLQMPTYPAGELSGYYQTAAQRYNDALSAAKASARQSADARAAALGQQYDALRGQAYAAARLSAIGNNERLAAKGLAGGLYGEARSGVSESSRIAQDTALRGAIAQAGRQEQAARDALALELLQQGYAADAQYAKNMAELALAQAKAQQEAEQNAYQAQWKQYQTALDLVQQLYKNTREQEKLDAAAAAAAAKAEASGTSKKKSASGKTEKNPLENILTDGLRQEDLTQKGSEREVLQALARDMLGTFISPVAADAYVRMLLK